MRNNDKSHSTVVNCTFSGNTANYNGGGMQNYDSSPTVVNCTFSGNKAINGCGMFNIDANPTLANTILWGNTALDGSDAPDIFQNGSTLTVKNCVVEAYILVDEANENIEDLIQTNPLLNGVDADLAPKTDPVKVYIYKLGTGSAAIDKGLPVGEDIGNCVKVPNKDQLGTTRPQGAGLDIGAFEAVYTITSVAVAPDTVSVETGQTQSFTATVTGTGAYNDTVTWSVEGKNSSGTTISDSGVLTVAADENAATLTVKATSNGDSTKSGTATVTVPTQPIRPPDHSTTTSTSTSTTSSGTEPSGPTTTPNHSHYDIYVYAHNFVRNRAKRAHYDPPTTPTTTSTSTPTTSSEPSQADPLRPLTTPTTTSTSTPTTSSEPSQAGPLRPPRPLPLRRRLRPQLRRTEPSGPTTPRPLPLRRLRLRPQLRPEQSKGPLRAPRPPTTTSTLRPQLRPEPSRRVRSRLIQPGPNRPEPIRATLPESK